MATKTKTNNTTQNSKKTSQPGSYSKKYKPRIGLEIHAELKTNSKMFCGCVNDPFAAEEPNIYTCPVCLGMPGALPVPNQKAIEWTIKLGLALNCKINKFSKFDRKHYFYPDLAKGYQISQYDIPFCYQGSIETSEGEVKIRRIHLEEDTGKLIHETIDGQPVSLIDFNRSGVPLVEIVSEPDVKNSQQAKEYSQNLTQVLRYLDISDCKMAEGGMRLEANVSLSKIDSDKLPAYKVELKNINSYRFLQDAIEYEIKRQTKILEQGQIPAQETRGWDPAQQQSFSQRSKEEAEDYRYFPEPDIPPLEFTAEQISHIQDSLPEMPQQVSARWQKEYQIEPYNAQQLTSNINQTQWAEQVFVIAQEENIKANDIANDIINQKIEVNSQTPAQKVIAAYQDLHQTVALDEEKLTTIINQVLAENQDVEAKYHAGKTQVLGFLMGQVMTRLDKSADPHQIKSALTSILKQRTAN